MKIAVTSIFSKILDENKELLPLFQKPALIAYSGGKDSTILLDFYTYLFEKKITPEPLLFHLNHSIRDNSEQELEIQEFLSRTGFHSICKKKNIPKLAIRLKKSLEDTGRIIRYHELNKIAKKKSLLIVTGHHSEDYLESVLVNLIRGAGQSALKTLAVYDKNIFRPLILFSKRQREKIISESYLRIFEDESNRSMDYLRNRIRSTINPFLLNEGIDIDKLYWNFHDKDEILFSEKESSYQEKSFCKVFIPTSVRVSQLKKILDSYLNILNLHPIKRKLLFEIYNLCKDKKDFTVENSEVIFWKSTKETLFLIPKSSPALLPPVYNSLNHKIIWNRKEFTLKEDESLGTYLDGFKLEHKNKTFHISEIMREREIPPMIRIRIPIVTIDEKPIRILFHLWDDNLRDFPNL